MLAAAEQTAGQAGERRQRGAVAVEDWDLLAVRNRRDLLAALVARVEIHPPE